jgi:ribonuclease-3
MTTLESALSYDFRDPELLRQALTHKSFHHECPDQALLGHNERLEFLGDAVLDLALSDLLFRRFPEENEGTLSKWRASLVNEDALSKIALKLNLDQEMLLGRGELKTGGGSKPRLLACAMEAVIGAVYLDAGLSASVDWVQSFFAKSIENLNHHSLADRDFKTRFQEVSQQMFRLTPSYKLVEQQGPDHDKVFFVQVIVGERVLASGCGKSKKMAEQEAARLALEAIE